VLTLPTVDTPFTVCKELPENKGVLLPSLSMDQNILASVSSNAEVKKALYSYLHICLE
jgi:hypothetical protein